MGLLQIEIAGSKTERKKCYYISFLIREKENMKVYLHRSLQVLLKALRTRLRVHYSS